MKPKKDKITIMVWEYTDPMVIAIPKNSIVEEFEIVKNLDGSIDYETTDKNRTLALKKARKRQQSITKETE